LQANLFQLLQLLHLSSMEIKSIKWRYNEFYKSLKQIKRSEMKLFNLLITFIVICTLTHSGAQELNGDMTNKIQNEIDQRASRVKRDPCEPPKKDVFPIRVGCMSKSANPLKPK
jgi:hypothetical protein